MPTLPGRPQSEARSVRPTLKVAVVARRLGVAPATLRTWARRYGLGPSAHVAGAHRQYSAGDLTRLVVMRRLTLEGVAPAEAARIALADGSDADAEGVLTSVVSLPAGTSSPDVDDALRGLDVERGGTEDPTAFGRAVGGRVVAMPSAGPAARGLARAALGLDAAVCRRILETGIGRDGVVATWEELARPVLVALGQRWEATGAGVDVEHLFSEAVLSSLRAVPAGVRRRTTATALLACSENDQHSLPVHVLGAALDERGVTVRVLGARVPREALRDAVRNSGPAAVLVYASMPVEDAGHLTDLRRLRPAPRLFVGGPGWAGVAVPGGARRVLSLPEAVEQVSAVLRP